MVDFRINADEMQEFISNMETIKADMLDMTSQIVSFQTLIQESTSWIGNGREECAAFLSLIAKYCSLIAGTDVVVSNSGSTVLAGKDVNGSKEHIDVFLKTLTEYHQNVIKFEKNASDKAACICILDQLQGE